MVLPGARLSCLANEGAPPGKATILRREPHLRSSAFICGSLAFGFNFAPSVDGYSSQSGSGSSAKTRRSPAPHRVRSIVK